MCRCQHSHVLQSTSFICPDWKSLWTTLTVNQWVWSPSQACRCRIDCCWSVVKSFGSWLTASTSVTLASVMAASKPKATTSGVQQFNGSAACVYKLFAKVFMFFLMYCPSGSEYSCFLFWKSEMNWGLWVRIAKRRSSSTSWIVIHEDLFKLSKSVLIQS